MPLGQSRTVMIMVHGRNAAPMNILELAARLDRPQVTYLAPAAASGSWYPYSFLSERAKNEPGISSGLHVLDTMVRDLVGKGIRRDHILLLGFSQGACLATEFAVRHPSRYGGVLALSGGLIGPPGTTWSQDGTFDGTPVFLGCSDVDAHIPRARVRETADVFRRMGAEVTERIYPGMGHLVNDDEIQFARELADRLMSSKAEP